MMRITTALIMAISLLVPNLLAQSNRRPATNQPAIGQPAGAQATRAQANAANQTTNPTRRGAAAANRQGQAPFAPLTPQAEAQLNQVLQHWEQQSQGTKTLEMDFQRFHYDSQMALANVSATKATGEIKYAAPDRGLIRVDALVHFNGLVEGKPTYKPAKNPANNENVQGEYWVCDGKQLIEMDRNAKVCKIQTLPPEMQGKNIISSPLPFVFNLRASQMRDRYWVREVPYKDNSLILLEVWPKRAQDRSQYKMVQVALDRNTYLPKALVMYAPNFDVKTAPVWDQYEFTNVRRNHIGARFRDFTNRLIPTNPGRDWKIQRSEFAPLAPDAPGQPSQPTRQATQTGPAANPRR